MIKLIKIEQGKIFRLSEIVEKVQNELAGHSFLSLCFEEQGGTLAVMNGKDYVAPLTGDEIRTILRDRPEQMLANDGRNMIIWDGGLPNRFEHLLQIAREVFVGRGFDEIRVAVPMKGGMVVSLACPPQHPRTIIPTLRKISREDLVGLLKRRLSMPDADIASIDQNLLREMDDIFHQGEVAAPAA